MLILASMPATTFAGTGSISGKVTMAGTGAAMADVKVCAYPIGWTDEPGEEGNVDGCTYTAADGTYILANLRSLIYQVEFMPDSEKFIWQFYKDQWPGQMADPVEVKSASVTGIDAVIQWPGHLEGTVTAAGGGQPVKGIEVCAYKWNEWGASCDWTAADGSYSIDIWEAGKYEVEFRSGKSGQNFAIQLYDHVDRIDEAELLSISLSEVIIGLDASLESGATISGHIAHSTAGPWQDQIQVCSIDAATDDIWTCGWSNKAGDYALRFLSPGPYKVVFAPEKTFPETEVEVPSGFQTQFWDYTTSLADASVVSVTSGMNVPDIDGWLGVAKPQPLAPSVQISSAPPVPKRGFWRKCRRGFHRKAVHGKFRCVRRRHAGSRRRHHSAK